MKNSEEMDKFNAGMDLILRANPKTVRDDMEHDKQEREAERKAKRASASRVSSDPND